MAVDENLRIIKSPGCTDMENNGVADACNHFTQGFRRKNVKEPGLSIF